MIFVVIVVVVVVVVVVFVSAPTCYTRRATATKLRKDGNLTQTVRAAADLTLSKILKRLEPKWLEPKWLRTVRS